ncbi:unnamed protein product [Symbiodinium sp. CCMP2456]|nr:unnamed protein product [Symbiodinium sp. CCMP2456]
MKDVEAGHAFILEGGEEEARRRWGKHVAAGKLGVVHASGKKKPRLFGDGSISGANQSSRIRERVRLPGLHSVQRFFSKRGDKRKWVALSFDVKGAHKLVLVREQERGFSCFVLDGKWFVWIPHALMLYVDDAFMLLPKSVGPLVASTAIMLVSALGVPLSWAKLGIGSDLIWIGWRFDFETGIVLLPPDKVESLLEALDEMRRKGQRLPRKRVEKVIGKLTRFTSGALWLRPWLNEFYCLLRKPRAVTRLLLVSQFENLMAVLSSDLAVAADMKECDILSRAGNFTRWLVQ